VSAAIARWKSAGSPVGGRRKRAPHPEEKNLEKADATRRLETE